MPTTTRCRPVVDPAEAAAAGPSLLFPGAGTNVAATFGDAGGLRADLFDGCDVVVTAAIVNQRVAPAPMETRAAAAVWGADGRDGMDPNQGAQGTRSALADMLGVDPAVVRIITPDVGGAFGAKFGADPEHAVVCWVARRLGRAARWAETRNENLVAMTHGRAQNQTVTIGGGRDGTVAAYRLEILQDAGAYGRFGAFLPALTILMAPGPYAFARAEAVAHDGGDEHHAGRGLPGGGPAGGHGRGGAGHRPFRRRDRHGSGGCARARTCCRSSLSRTRPRSAPCTTAATTRRRWRRCWPRPATRTSAADQAKRRAAGDVVQLGIGLSCYVEITGAGDGSGRPARECHGRGPSRRQRHDPDRDLPARAGPRHRVGHAGQR